MSHATNASGQDQTLHPRLSPMGLLSRSFRHRNFRLFFAGQFVSLIGTWMQSVAVSWLVYRLTGSSLSLGMVGFVSHLPVFVLGLWGGYLADRGNKRAILVATQTAAMLQALALAALTFAGEANVWLIGGLAMFLGVVNAVDMPTRQSFVVEMVGKEDLHNAIALNSSMFNSARVLGPAMAGILVAAIGEGWCFLGNGVSYLAVIISLLCMRLPAAAPCTDSPRLRAQVAEGLAYAWRDHPIREILLSLGLTSLFGASYMVLMLGGGGKGERARILIDAKAEDGGFICRQIQLPGDNLFHKNTRGGAPGLHHGQGGRHVFVGIRVMVVAVDDKVRVGERPFDMGHAGTLSGVHQNQGFHAGRVDFLEIFEVEEVRGALDEKVPDIFFLAARENKRRAGIQLAGGDNGRQTIEIRIGVSGNNGGRSQQHWFGRKAHK